MAPHEEMRLKVVLALYSSFIAFDPERSPLDNKMFLSEVDRVVSFIGTGKVKRDQNEPYTGSELR